MREPAFESAYRRYGTSLQTRPYQACNNGPVVETKKYGKATLANNRAMMRSKGCSLSIGFQLGPGRNADPHVNSRNTSTATARIISSECTTAWARGLNRPSMR